MANTLTADVLKNVCKDYEKLLRSRKSGKIINTF